MAEWGGECPQAVYPGILRKKNQKFWFFPMGSFDFCLLKSGIFFRFLIEKKGQLMNFLREKNRGLYELD